LQVSEVLTQPITVIIPLGEVTLEPVLEITLLAPVPVVVTVEVCEPTMAAVQVPLDTALHVIEPSTIVTPDVLVNVVPLE
jgi:hypothetical protein